jgi:hypothetical protein
MRPPTVLQAEPVQAIREAYGYLGYPEAIIRRWDDATERLLKLEAGADEAGAELGRATIRVLRAWLSAVKDVEYEQGGQTTTLMSDAVKVRLSDRLGYPIVTIEKAMERIKLAVKRKHAGTVVVPVVLVPTASQTETWFM